MGGIAYVHRFGDDACVSCAYQCFTPLPLSKKKQLRPSVFVQCMQVSILRMNRYVYDCYESNMDLFVKPVADSNCVDFDVWE